MGDYTPNTTDGATPEFTCDEELKPGAFVQTASWFLRHEAIRPETKLLYQILLTYAGEGVKAWAGQARLARECGVSERLLRDLLKQLVAMKLLTVTRLGLGQTNRYHLKKLPTLPPKGGKSKRQDGGDDTHKPSNPDRQDVPFSTGTENLSGPAPAAGELDTDELDTGEGTSSYIHSPAGGDTAAENGTTIVRTPSGREGRKAEPSVPSPEPPSPKPTAPATQRASRADMAEVNALLNRDGDGVAPRPGPAPPPGCTLSAPAPAPGPGGYDEDGVWRPDTPHPYPPPGPGVAPPWRGGRRARVMRGISRCSVDPTPMYGWTWGN